MRIKTRVQLRGLFLVQGGRRATLVREPYEVFIPWGSPPFQDPETDWVGRQVVGENIVGDLISEGQVEYLVELSDGAKVIFPKAVSHAFQIKEKL